MLTTASVGLDKFTTFGDLLRYLRRREGLTQRELSIAVGYSEAQISRLEQNQRLPDPATITARFAPALHLEQELEVVARLLELTISAGASPRHNLPTQLTSFIGREREMAEVGRRLSASRLVTLTGPGGCGKTRLALQVAAELVAGYPDGVWLIELAPVSDPALVPQKVASILGVREELGQPLATALANHLREKSSLLVLDNCEHLVEACAQLTEMLLHACPGLRILATSREVLSLTGETAWRVPPLSLPDPRYLPPIENFTQYEAVLLFIDRVVSSLPGFAVTTQNAPAVAQVCHRLDGMPLAIELAAARVGMLRVEQIAARLDDRFNLLTGGSRAALRRHQTLQAAIDWSYDLLSEAEQALLGRLAAFVGGWTLEAAEAVCEGDGVKGSAVLELLTQLVNKSLVIAQREPGQETRYRLLETIHEYALARLATSGAEAVVALRRHHTNFFLALAEEAEPRFASAERPAWLKRLEPEHSNFLAALEWALESAPDTGLRLVGALLWFWYHLGYFSEGRRWFDRAATLAGSLGKTEGRAKALYAAAFLARAQGDYVAARSLNEESVAIWRGLEAGRGLGHSLAHLGRVALAQSDLTAAHRHLEESIAVLQAVGDKWGLGKSLIWLGCVARAQGDDMTARSLFNESAAIERELGEMACLSVSLGYLGYVASQEGDYAAARSFFEESFTIWREVPDPWSIAWGLEGLAEVARVQGQVEQAAQLFGAAEALLEAIGVRLDAFDRADYERNVATVRTQLGELAFAQAWAEGRAMTVEQAIAYALENLESHENHRIYP